MAADRTRVALSPLLGTNSRRVSDHALGGTYMRGGYNVELRDGEWWSRQGETLVTKRLGSTPWWWIFDVNRDLTVIANPWWALALDGTGKVTELYTAAVTENLAVTNGSAAATSTTNRTVAQLILAGAGATNSVYRVASHVGNAVTLDRPYEGATNAALSCRYVDPLPRDITGTSVGYTTTLATNFQGSAVVYEQLVTHAAADSHAASPALTGRTLLLVITSNIGVPVAIDLSAYLAGATAGVKRSWFYNTALATALVIGSDSTVDQLKARGVWAEVYKGRLFIAAATDPNGAYGSRTIWYSQIGDLLWWHTGIKGQTATPNFKTFDGEGDPIGEMKTLQDSLVIHRQWKQEICNDTQSLAQPFTFRTNAQGIGVFDRFPSNRVVSTQNVHFLWTPQGPAVFDGNTVTPIAQDAAMALAAYTLIQAPNKILHVQHDSVRRRIYWWQRSISQRHQAALPATATITFTSGDQVQNYLTCFVLDYANNAYWFEDRPHSFGGGSATSQQAISDTGVLHLSRVDGTIVKMFGSSATIDTADTDLLAPDVANDVIVNAQVETPWLDFGSLQTKRLTEVELIHRYTRGGEGQYDKFGGTGASLVGWLRIQFYSDFLAATQRAGVGVARNDTLFPSTAVEFNQSPTGPALFTPKIDGRQFKMVISNALTAAAIAAGYEQMPFRVSDIHCEYTQGQSTVAAALLNSGYGISETAG